MSKEGGNEFNNNNVMLRDLAKRKDPLCVRLMEFYTRNFDIDPRDLG